jgi:L-amino acid N-acyltransferase YncA
VHASGDLVRPASATDAPACLAVYRPYFERAVISWEIDVPSENEMAARIAATQAGHEWLVLERDRRVIGLFVMGGRYRRKTAPTRNWVSTIRIISVAEAWAST